jgi:hypothetical protein
MILPVLASIALAGCSKASTAIVVFVQSDLVAGHDVDRLDVSMAIQGAQAWSDRHDLDGPSALPMSLRLTPPVEGVGAVGVSVELVRADRSVIEAEREVGFIEGQVAEVRFCLWSACIGSATLACTEGQCAASSDGDADLDQNDDAGEDVEVEAEAEAERDAQVDADADADEEADADADDAPLGWTEVTTGPSPSARSGHAMAYDSTRGVVVLFGGATHDVAGVTSVLGDTWEYDEAGWRQVSTTASPASRWGHAMAYDSARELVVLFGGVPDDESGMQPFFADTWEYDGADWTEVLAASAPEARAHHAMAYDQARGDVILYAGAYMGPYSDTWHYHAAGWTQVSPPSSPGHRTSHAMVYDSAREVVVLFGGWDDSGRRADTWEYDAGGWTEAFPRPSPPERYSHAMAYDSTRGVVVLFGGLPTAFGHLADTWEYDGASWIDVSPPSSPPGREDHAMAYDSARGAVVLFGGLEIHDLDDTWEYRP